MPQNLLLILIVIFLFFVIRIIVKLESRVIRKIKLDAINKEIEINEIRDPNDLDGKNPFGNFSFSFGSSKILGFSGERLYHKIVIEKNTNGYTKYWVRARTIFFMPSDVDWKKIT